MIETPPLLGYLVVAAVSFTVGILTLPLAHRIGVSHKMIDVPREGEAQDRPLPRSGGYALYAAFFAGLLAAVLLFPRYPGEWIRLAGLSVCALLILPVAYLDDRYRLGPWPQLAAQIVVAGIAVLFTIQIDMVRRIDLPVAIAVPFTIFWIVGMINTVNFADGVDGLAGGIGAIAATTLFFVSVLQGQYSIAALPLALAASAIAFLRWNFFPSRIILGSSGATLIGFLLAVFAIIGGAKIAAALMVLGLPIADVATVIVYRLLHRRSPFKGGDRAHLHHRLLDLGLTQRQVVYLFYAVTAFLGALAISLGAAGGERWPGLIPMAVIVVGVLAYVLSKTWRPANASRR